MVIFCHVMALALVATADPADTTDAVRVAVFNIWELSGEKLKVHNAKGHGRCPQLQGAAEIIQRVRPDVLLINEIDFDAKSRRNAQLFQDRYLRVSQNGQPPIEYEHIFFEPVNTGVPTGLDLDNDKRDDGPADAFGYGRYPGQYGMALFSRFPIDRKRARTFQKLKWQDMPDNLMPDGQRGKPNWYAPEEARILRLSSKSHWDVPVRVGDHVLRLLCSHPTPPVFDGSEDRNGRRAYDELRFWSDYLTGGDASRYIVDDDGRQGGLPDDAHFVLLGDLNADPNKDEARYGKPAIAQILSHKRVRDPEPASEGAVQGARVSPDDPRRQRTCDFGRIDYVLPSRTLHVASSGVFWPSKNDPLHRLVGDRSASSDHRLVWVDLRLRDAE